jgi:hypothetical protein
MNNQKNIAVLCTFGHVLQIYFYKYFAVLLHYIPANASPLSTGINCNKLYNSPGINESEQQTEMRFHQPKGAEHRNICR